MSDKNSASGRAKESSVTAQSVALSSVMIALALIFSYIEALFPFNFGVPGIKLGLSNLIILIALYCLGASYAFTINIIRIIIAGLLFGGVSGILYSLAGGITSFIVMLILKKSGCFSPVGISLAGGVMHNVGQLVVAALVTETAKLFLYMPVLLLSGIITGCTLGVGAVLVLNRMEYITGK